MMSQTTPTRHDAFLFYAMASISFLESAVPDYVENLAPFYRDQPEIVDWLEAIWLPEEVRHGRETRRYVQALWPTFDWEGGYEIFLSYYRPCCRNERLRPTPALEALARCVTETQAAMIYRCIAAYTHDAELKRLFTGMSQDEVRHYAYFRDVFHDIDQRERNAFFTKAAIVIGRSELVKTEDLALAFQPLNACWRNPKPFGELTYRQFLAATGRIMATHLPFEAAKRMLVRPLRSGAWYEHIAADVLAFLVKRQYVNTIRSMPAVLSAR